MFKPVKFMSCRRIYGESIISQDPLYDMLSKLFSQFTKLYIIEINEKSALRVGEALGR
jgi:hypothetical protein